MENPVISPCPGSVAPSLTQAEGKSHHEFFPKGATREVLLLGDLEEQEVHHIERGKKKLCFLSSAGRCPLCDVAPFEVTLAGAQVEFVAPAYVRPIRETTFVQRVVVFPRRAGEQVKELCGDAQRGRLLRIVRGMSNRLDVKLVSGLPDGIPATLPPAFPVMPFVRALFGLRPDPRVPVMKLPPIRCETPRTATVRSQRLRFTSDDADRCEPEALEALRAKLAEWKAADGQAVTAPAAKAPAAPPPAAVVEPAEVTAAVPAPKAPALTDATNDQLRVEAIRRTFGLNGAKKPAPPPELTDTVADVIGAAAAGGTERIIPPIKKHADGTWTGPATVPYTNGHHSTNGKPKGGR